MKFEYIPLLFLIIITLMSMDVVFPTLYSIIQGCSVGESASVEDGLLFSCLKDGSVLNIYCKTVYGLPISCNKVNGVCHNGICLILPYNGSVFTYYRAKLGLFIAVISYMVFNYAYIRYKRKEVEGVKKNGRGER